LEALEARRLLDANTIQNLPWTLDFNSDRGELVDKDGQGIGFTRVQANKNGNEYQPNLLDLDLTAGVLRVTTTGNATNGTNSGSDNSLVNALETQFDGTSSGFAITARLIGPLSFLNDPFEQAGIYFGPNQDNFVKLVAIRLNEGQFLQFSDEQNGTTGTLPSSAQRISIGSFSSINTLDLRLVGDNATGKVLAYYAINGGSYVKVTEELTLTGSMKGLFFNGASRTGIIAAHKNNVGPITAVYDSFSITPGTPIAGRPFVTSVNPASGATNVPVNGFVAATVSLPTPGAGVMTSSLAGNVKLYRTSDLSPVLGVVNTSGGGDIIVFQPQTDLATNTSYTFEVTDQVRDTSGAQFLPFTSTFTTSPNAPVVDPNIAFEQVQQTNAQGESFTGVTMGPDGKLYATTIDGKILRFTIDAATGNLGAPQTISTIQTREGGPRMLIGLVFDPASTASNLIAYATHNQYAFQNATDWTGKLTRLTGANLQNGQDLLIGLPRSVRDHLTNQLVFGPDGALYISQGANTAMGAPDNAWGLRPERLLSAAVLRVNLAAISTTLNVQTEGIANPYNPFAANAPVTIYASGVRNAYDLLWHSNGNLYAPTNGSAAGGNTPASPNPAYSTTRIDFPINGAYNGPVVPGINNVTATQNDYLYNIKPLGYYGSPNPTRYEWVLNGGNPTSGVDLAEVTQYPVGTQPDRNYRGFAFDFGKNYSPNGVIEFKGNAFNGALNGRIVVARYSGGDDLIFLTPGAGGAITASQTGFAGTTHFVDPLDVTQYSTDLNKGWLYVAEYGAQRITLLRPIAPGGKIQLAKDKFQFNDIQTASGHSAASPAQTLTITNTGVAPLSLPSDAFTLTGTNAGDFLLSGQPTLPATLQPGASVTLQIAFRATAVGIRTATLVVKSNDPNTPQVNVSLRGLGTTGLGGSNEPSLQRILDLYEIPVNVGDNNPAVTAFPVPPVTPNDEVVLPRLVKAGAGPVTIETLAVMAGTNPSISARLGYYSPGTGAQRTQLLQYTQADAQTVWVANGPSTATFDPGTAAFGLYGQFPDFNNRNVFSEDSLNTWETVTSRQRKVRFYPLKTSAGVTVPNAYVFAFEEWEVSFDQNDIVGIIRNVMPAAAGPEIGLDNLTGTPFADRLVFSRIQNPNTDFPNYVHDRSTLRIRNTGSSALTINSLNFAGPFVLHNTVSLPATINAGGFLDVQVRFTATSGNLNTGTLTISSDDADEPSTVVQLAGYFQTHSEVTPSGVPVEPLLPALVQLFGYNMNVGTVSQIFGGGLLAKVGQETLSSYWQRAEAGVPVSVLQLAAYHQQQYTATIRWHYEGSPNNLNTIATHHFLDGQTIFPRKSGQTTLTTGSFNPNNNFFGFKVDGEYSDNTLNFQQQPGGNYGHHIRWYQVRDQAGKPIPDTWLMCVDYGASEYRNFDYQDNLYLVHNIRPKNPPSTPTQLTGSGSGAGITLNWTANTEGNVAGYRVYRSSSSGGTYTLLNSSLITSPSYLDVAAPIGTSFYRVTAVDLNGGESNFASVSATRSADTSPPAAPTGLVATGTSSGINLDWNDNTEADLAGYIVYRASTSSGPYTRISGTSLLPGSVFFDSSAPSNATSFYRVTAVDLAGNESAFASASAFRPNPGQVPAAPSNLTALVISGTQVNLTWADNSGDETGFRIERKVGALGTYSEVGTVGANVTFFADFGVIPNTEYYYRVRASGTGGDSGYSNEAIASTTAQTVPAAPSNLAAAANSPTQVTLTWTDNSNNELGFRVERRAFGALEWTRIVSTGPSTTSYVDATAAAGTQYTYRIFSFNSAGDSTYSNEATVTTPLSAAYTSADIGSPTPAGSTTVVTESRDYNVTAGGGDIFGTSDQFRFVYRQVTGDFDYRVRVAALGAPVPESQAGLMVRETLAANAKNVTVKVREIGFRMSYRTTTGGSSTGAGSGTVTYPNAWVRLQRVGGNVTGYSSNDGVNWSSLGTIAITLPQTVFFGMAVAARTGNGTPTTAQFRDLSDTFAPAAPSSLDASRTGAGVLLTWTDNALTETGFRIERRTGTGEFTPLGTVGANTTTFLDASAAGSQAYGYRVIAFNGAGDSSASNEATVSGGSGSPPLAPPTSLASTSIASTGITIEWVDNSSDETGFAIQRKAGTDGGFAVIGQVGANVTTFSDTQIVEGTSYTYRVVGVRGTEQSAPSNELTLNAPVTPPAAPTGVSAVANGPTSVTVSWSDQSANEASFRIERRIGTGAWEVVGTVAANVSSFTDTTASASTTYTYAVFAVNNGGSSQGPTATVTTPAGSSYSLTSFNIGQLQSNGSTTVLVDGRDYDVQFAGSQVAGTSDNFRFLYTQFTGDFDVRMRIVSMQNTNATAAAGIMARATLDANSALVFANVKPGGGHRTTVRAAANASATHTADHGNTWFPTWVRLVRSGNTFTQFFSANGTTWTQASVQTVSLPQTVFLGIAGFSRVSGTMATSIRDFSISAG
jgi:fibronectin type 3 domain-containing protein/regulation of enolase protein 1 (concanavalin A-like superfamily)